MEPQQPASKVQPSRPQRVVSLLGASTETIYRLGLESVLVGRSHECDYPPACLDLPCVSRPRLDPDALTSAQIDAVVRDFSAQNEPVYKLQDETLQELAPDLLIAQDQCRVCAVTARDINNASTSTSTKESVCRNIPQLILKPATLHDCLNDVLLVANALGYPERGLQLHTTLQHRMDRVKHLADSIEESKRPRVALLEWCDPTMGCGYWLPELASLAGAATCVFSCPPGGATPTLSFSQLVNAQPDVVVLALCGFSISRTAREIRQAWTKAQIDQLQTVTTRGVFVTDGNYLFNRSGPRVVESAEVLLEAFHGSAFRGHFDHFGSPFLMTLDDALALDEGVETGAIKRRAPVQQEETTMPTATIPPPTIDPPLESASDMVRRQLLCLRNQDIVHAFAFNSIANQKRWCDPERFGQVLASHADFKRLLVPEVMPILTEDNPIESNGLVTVELPNHGLGETGGDGGPAIILQWTCVVEHNENDGESHWRTEKVGLQQS
jgi:iron complex transport system substrate-binding protein